MMIGGKLCAIEEENGGFRTGFAGKGKQNQEVK
jgi:hypothetical protein